MSDTRPHSFERMRALFDAALEQPAAERAAFLREACGDDEALFDGVKALLAAHDTDVDFEEIVGRAARDLVGEESPSLLRQRVGNY